VSTEFQKAIEKKKILRFPKAKYLVKKELKVAKDDLLEANDRFVNKRYKYATITAYYSMFHSALMGKCLLRRTREKRGVNEWVLSRCQAPSHNI
jgi:hypothetical protein